MIKKEVRKLCYSLIQSHKNNQHDEFERLERILKNKYGFTAYQLLALFGNPPTIEYGDNNFSYVME